MSVQVGPGLVSQEPRRNDPSGFNSISTHSARRSDSMLIMHVRFGAAGGFGCVHAGDEFSQCFVELPPQGTGSPVGSTHVRLYLQHVAYTAAEHPRTTATPAAH
jgi:hypothetical protein